ncbi:MAG: serine hydrolase [Oscillospiraceae bacterium]|nr:serine hydrolase [Oscillospiraceae bacterium]
MASPTKAKRQLSQRGALLLLVLMFGVIAVTTFVIVMIFGAPKSKYPKRDPNAVEETMPPMTDPPTEPPTEPPPIVSYPDEASDMQVLDTEERIQSEHAFLMDCDTNEILAVKGGADTHIYPASMTKLMTIAVATEFIENEENDLSWDDTFTFTDEILSPLYEQSASMAGFQSGEAVCMRDLIYGAALPSGADATVGLALATAGSEEEFVRWMNDKVDELGLVNTHFVNTSGLYNENHYSSVTDIALIMEYCLSMDMSRQAVSVVEYTTKPTEQHPDGIQLLSTMFNKMYGTEVPEIKIMGGKTGYTDEAGQCLASYAETMDGHRYVAVTSKGSNKWQPVYDAFKLYGLVTGTYDMDQKGNHTS